MSGGPDAIFAHPRLAGSLAVMTGRRGRTARTWPRSRPRWNCSAPPALPARRGHQAQARVISCTTDSALHNGWAKDSFGREPADLTVPAGRQEDLEEIESYTQLKSVNIRFWS